MNKRYFIIISLLVLLASSGVISAQGSSFIRYGVTAGLNFNSLPGNDGGSSYSGPGFQAGVAFQINVPIRGLAIQPNLLYSAQAAKLIDTDVSVARIDYIEVPVGIQYGFDLILLRPFLELTPFAGVAVNRPSASKVDAFNNFGYGLGIGGGLDVWRFQIRGIYKWHLEKTISEWNLNQFALTLAFFL